jgi:Mrp family chromosome partitioning ATPase
MTTAAIDSAADAIGTVVIGVLGISKDVDDAAVCSNIALLNARAGKRTLLVETDTGRSNLTASFAPDLHFDLKDVIEAGAAPQDAIVSYGDERMLSLLFLGNTETPDFWTPERVEKLRTTINELRGQYDNIFVHLPPASDGDLASRAVDSALIVSEMWRTKVSVLEELASRMRIADQPLLGVVAANFS